MTTIVDFDLFMKSFPNVKNKSKKLAKKLLPLYSSEDLAEIAGYLLSDGHIEWYTSDGRPRTRKIMFYSNHENECIEFLKLCRDVFKVDGKIEKYHSSTGFSDIHSYRAIIRNAVIARILILAGIPAGDKTKTDFSVPEWILTGDTEIKKSFLRALYNFDGSVPHLKVNAKCSWQMGFSVSKRIDFIENGIEFLKSIKKLFKEFDIHFGKTIQFEHRKNKHVLMISMDNQKSIINFYTEIGFLSVEKQAKLINAAEMISLNGRLYTDTKILNDLKRKIGTDEKAVSEINKHSIKRYTKRQFEHMRRNESKIPFDMLFSVIQILGNEKEIEKMEEYMRNVFEVYKNYRSRSPRMNSSSISRAT